MTSAELSAHLAFAGVNPDSLVCFEGEISPRHMRYLDLISKDSDSSEPLPDAVIETGGQPFVYVVRSDRLGDLGDSANTRLAELIRVLACRSDARYLGVVAPGTLHVYPIGIFETAPETLKLRDTGDKPSWRALLSGATPLFSSTLVGRSDYWLETLLFRLLVDAAEGIHTAVPTLTIQQVIALVGRALFFRFLVDRQIVSAVDAPSISVNADRLEDMFASSAALVDTCKWLDQTFNGDLLSLGDKDYCGLIQLFGNSVDTVCWHLTNIQYRAVGGQLPLDWGGIKFRHVPVDVLSQVYEDFAHKFVPELARQTSVHFTPRQIAEVVIDGAFSAVKSSAPHLAKVLDPAAGAGVFLVLSLRRLATEHWKATNVRPDRNVIRRILMTQLTGLDINEDALNIAALSLYLAALELDPAPSPLGDLKFRKLIGSVLHPVDAKSLSSQNNDRDDSKLGSLSAQVIERFSGQFDIVVANPPWTGLKGNVADALNRCLVSLVDDSGQKDLFANDVETENNEADRLERKAQPEQTAQLSPITTVSAARYGSPDVAFLLAASRWAKPSGALGFALHARLLFQRASFPLRRQIFEKLRVTGVMNFAALRQDKKLWPSNAAPFALLVARNERPSAVDSCYYISPRHEPYLAEMGQFRIDPTAATPVPFRLFKNDPVAPKAIFKGGLLGQHLLAHIRNQGVTTVAEHLSSLELKFFSGYQLGKPEERKRKSSHLKGLPLASVDSRFQVTADGAKFDYDFVQWPRTREIYDGPLLMFRESPKADRYVRGALYSESDAVYNESFFGLSFKGKPELRPFMDLLYVLSYSDLLLYFQLLTSSKFGVERDASLQSDLDEFPLVDYKELAPDLSEQIRTVATSLRSGQHCWDKVDDLVASLYDLSAADQQLIKDTLATELPFTNAKRRANNPPERADLEEYTKTFNKLVAPFVSEEQAQMARPVYLSGLDGWSFIEIQSPSQNLQQPRVDHESDLPLLAEVASNYWASQFRVCRQDGSELVGRLNQWRYWTRTQARLQALDWIRNAPPISSKFSQ